MRLHCECKRRVTRLVIFWGRLILFWGRLDLFCAALWPLGLTRSTASCEPHSISIFNFQSFGCAVSVCSIPGARAFPEQAHDAPLGEMLKAPRQFILIESPQADHHALGVRQPAQRSQAGSPPAAQASDQQRLTPRGPSTPARPSTVPALACFGVKPVGCICHVEVEDE